MQTRLDPLTRALREILDSVVTEPAREALLEDALAAGGLGALPATAAGLLEFIEGPLLVTLERALGQELGRSVVDELERWIGPLSTRHRAVVALPCVVVTDATRSSLPPPPPGSVAREELGRRPTVPATRPAVPTDPHPPASGDYPHGMARALGLSPTQPPSGESTPAPGSARALPLVFVATLDPELVARFTEWLDPRAVIVRMSRLIDLLLDIEDAGARRVVIVLDGARPSVRLEAVAAIADELPRSVRVVLWGSSGDAMARLCRISHGAARWISVPAEAPLGDVVERCAALVG